MFSFLNRKKASLDRTFQSMDKAVAGYMSMIIDGLSDPDRNARKEIAEFLSAKVSVALSDETRPDRQKDSAQLLQVLSSELRPPENLKEINDLRNAVFWFLRRELMESLQ